MNRERVLELADRLEKGTITDLQGSPVRFDIRYWNVYICGTVRFWNVYLCGTVCCIGGSAERLWPGEGKAFRLLGLNEEEADKLFRPTEYAKSSPDDLRFTLEAAVKQLRYLAETGDCHWPHDRQLPADGEAKANE